MNWLKKRAKEDKQIPKRFQTIDGMTNIAEKGF